MMKNVFSVIFVSIFLLACSSTPRPPSPTPTINPVALPHQTVPVELNTKFTSGQCHVKTVVGSRGSGVDRSINGVAHALHDFQMMSPLIANYYNQSWGKENEVAFCSQVPNPANVSVLETQLNQVVNDYTGTIRGSVGVTTN